MTLFRAWILLLVLSGLSAAFAEYSAPADTDAATMAAGGAGMLCLTWLKARTILASYLRLDETPAARRIFGLILGLYLLLLGGLFLLPLA
ncbi:hypothetical protein ORIO_19475 [Cereibacter azotoformans]|uniref:Nitric oxide reductase F protein n=1 Tax=Cereibacter sphaeroides (strain ATCC 17025 / ATH 2.4.3) TaxID=349102 RepID=A4WYT2_CERS5|nr:hypothetical protein [Cereibacter azotoformans]ULB12004.1 hypothetical protein ORIO_19475 [Cereibacter azotoformans]